MDKKAKAQAYLEKDFVYYVNLLEVLRRDSADVLAAEEQGVVLWDQGSRAYMFALERGGEDLLELIPRDAELVTGCAPWTLPRVREEWGFTGGTQLVVRSAAWTRPEPPQMPAFDGELRLLDRSWAPWAVSHYSSDFGGVPYMEGAVDRGLIGAFVDGKPAGFVGFHEEGTIGMLEVLPEYRRRGLALALETAAIRLALSRGQYAFCQVELENAASMSLQQKLGMAVSQREIYWLFR